MQNLGKNTPPPPCKKKCMQHHVHIIVFQIPITGSDEQNAQQYNSMTQSEIQTQVETV